MSKYIFETKMEVRDYECDIEGIVNNANYLHYMEHTRHLFLKECGLSFAEMHNKGVDAVVARMNLQYKVPLQCDDEFLSRLWLEKQGVRYIFHQDIFRANDEKLCLKATVELVCLINGRLGNSEDYDKAFKRWLKKTNLLKPNLLKPNKENYHGAITSLCMETQAVSTFSSPYYRPSAGGSHRPRTAQPQCGARFLQC